MLPRFMACRTKDRPIQALGTKCAVTIHRAREVGRDMRGRGGHAQRTSTRAHTYLGVIADKGGAVARIHGARAEVALDNPHGSLLVPVLLCGSGVREISALWSTDWGMISNTIDEGWKGRGGR